MKYLAITAALLALGLGLTTKLLLDSHRRNGEVSAALDLANQAARDNERVYQAALDAKDAEIAGLRRARELSEAAAQASLRNERQATARVERLELELREAMANDQESRDWGAARVPDAVLDRMRDAIAAAGQAH